MPNTITTPPPPATAKTITPDALLAQLHWRYATKKFDSARMIDAATWSKLEDSLVLTPSSFGMQPWKFFVVTDKVVKAKLAAASWNQTQPADCSHLVVFAGRSSMVPADVQRLIDRTASQRGVAKETLDGYKNVILGFIANPPPGLTHFGWASKQCYIALGQFMASCAALGIDACPMEGIVPSQYDEILGLSAQGYSTVVVCPAGYRAADDKYQHLAKVRFEKSEVIAHI